MKIFKVFALGFSYEVHSLIIVADNEKEAIEIAKVHTVDSGSIEPDTKWGVEQLDPLEKGVINYHCYIE